MKKDPRNFLFEHYVKILNEFLPKFFVFENVTGILSANVNNEPIIDKVFAELGKHYNLVDPSRLEFNMAEYGVPQVRRRIIIMGVRKDLNITPDELYDSLKKTHYLPDTTEGDKKKLKKFISVKEAIGDLPSIPQGHKSKSIPFSYSTDNEFISWVKTMRICFMTMCAGLRILPIPKGMRKWPATIGLLKNYFVNDQTFDTRNSAFSGTAMLFSFGMPLQEQ